MIRLGWGNCSEAALTTGVAPANRRGDTSDFENVVLGNEELSHSDHLQTNRFELKYVIDEQRAGAVRHFISSYLEPDEHARGNSACSYPVYSLYMDAPTLVLYRQTTEGLKNRFKLRIRFYDGQPTSPVFLEIKRRLSGVICKERAALRREGAEILLNGARPGLSHLIQSHGSRRGQSALDRFCDLCEELGAVGVAYVAYMREAYVQPNSDNLRVTFDRQLYGQEFDVREGLVVPTRGVSPNVDGVILELKFVDRFPCWMRDMVRALDLDRCSMAKYVHCVETLDLHSSHGCCPQSR